MAVSSSASPAPAKPSRAKGFALAGKFLVIVVFMTQFMLLILGLGGVLPTLYRQGVNRVILGLGALAAFAVLQALLGFVMRRLPVRCPACGGRSYFVGFGWWPFIYRFNCGGCGMQRRFEVGGR